MKKHINICSGDGSVKARTETAFDVETIRHVDCEIILVDGHDMCQVCKLFKSTLVNKVKRVENVPVDIRNFSAILCSNKLPAYIQSCVSYVINRDLVFKATMLVLHLKYTESIGIDVKTKVECSTVRKIQAIWMF